MLDPDPDEINADPQPCCIWFLVADCHAMLLLCGGGVGRPDGRGVRALVQPGRGNPGAGEHQGPAGAPGSQDQSSPLQGRWTPSRFLAGVQDPFYFVLLIIDPDSLYRSKKVKSTGANSNLFCLKGLGHEMEFKYFDKNRYFQI
jgi:hypothetical protein